VRASACRISSNDFGPWCARPVRVNPQLACHLGVQEVLVDRGQLAGELLIEQLQDLGVPFASASPLDGSCPEPIPYSLSELLLAEWRPAGEGPWVLAADYRVPDFDHWWAA